MAFQPPRLGPGAIYLRSLDSVYRTNSDLIKVVEIEPQTLWTKGTIPGSIPRGNAVELRHVSALPQKLLTHGVGSPVGGTICDQERHVPEFRKWTEQLRSPWTSEHLSILDVRGARGEQPCGFLMPPLQTDQQVELAATNIKRRAAALALPFAFETGVNYFSQGECEMADGDFFAAVAEAADCGILLDLTNLWANHRNGRARIDDILARLPLERVWEVHLAGLEFAHGYWLDAHSNGIDPELAELALDVVANLPNLGAIIFEISPDRTAAFGAKAFLKEMEKLNRLWDAVRDVPVATPNALHRIAGSQAPSPEEWERFIANRMLPPWDRPSVGVESMLDTANDEQSFKLYAWLAASFRRGAIAELLENTTRLLLVGMGESALRDLMDRYVAATPPVAFPTDEALSFRRYMLAHPVSVPGLEDVLKFESALIEATVDAVPTRVDVSTDIDMALGEIRAGRLPGPSSKRPGTVLEVGVSPAPFVRALN
jgi:uncharacterized protein (UPF0276 family)